MSQLSTHAALQNFEGSLRAFVARRVRESELEDVLQDVFVRVQRGLADQRGRARLREAFDACCHIALDARRRVIDYVPRGRANSTDCCE